MTFSKKLAASLAVLASLIGAPSAVAAERLGKPLSVEECWRCLPIPASGGGQRLPNWALVTARPLPRTTAAMLELDWLHRTRNAIGPVLRGKMRWVAAAANRCEYARATAEADLRRAGLDECASSSDLKKGPDRWATEERAALKFARQMTLDAGSVTDAEVAELRKRYGEEKLVAMVLLLAYSNFQDRLLLTLGVPLEEGGPLAPVEVHFPRGATPPPVPERARPADLSGRRPCRRSWTTPSGWNSASRSSKRA